MSLGLGLGLETQSLGLGLGLDKKVLFTSLRVTLRYCCNDRCYNQLSFVYNTLGACCNNWCDNRSSHRMQPIANP